MHMANGQIKRPTAKTYNQRKKIGPTAFCITDMGNAPGTLNVPGTLNEWSSQKIVIVKARKKVIAYFDVQLGYRLDLALLRIRGWQ